jgi:hypothetical protein
MNTKALLRSGFAHCVFVNKAPKTIEGIVMRVVNDPKVALFPKKPNDIKVEPINDMSDKVTLSFDDEEVISVWTWKKSVDGKSYALLNIE